MPAKHCWGCFCTTEPWGRHVSAIGSKCIHFGVMQRVAYAYTMFDFNAVLRIVPPEILDDMNAYTRWLLSEHEGSRAYSNGLLVRNIWVLTIAMWKFLQTPVNPA
ncbi:hypothetical protein EIP91_010707 [Steccherinum ochraceum]|uniref:Uncharacterized protein n=1 Tax=Steccherinum ochraceum TaxID=92696 RepID=A0A4R0R0A5_9APHY|nr:hypothetical protein EIP91_010707 [Steccherinum ochraceum]